MKTLFSAFCLSLFVIMISCKSGDKQEATGSITPAVESDDDRITGVCIWKEISVKESPADKGKYLTSIYLGEKLEVLEDTASEVVSGKRNRYNKVKLIDGTTGWVRSDFLAVNAVPAAFLNESLVYKRPDLMTSSKKSFAPMDFVAIKNTNDAGWSEVVGKRKGDSWFTSGWVRSENLTRTPKDVMFSVLYGKAMEMQDLAARSSEIQNLLLNSDLQGSSFYEMVSESLADVEEGYDDSESATDSTSVN